MKNKIAAVLMVAGAPFVTLAGCETRQPQEEVRTVDWYESNPAERAAKLAECLSNPKIRDAMPNCVNASRAENNAKAAPKWGTGKESVRTEPIP